MATPEEIEKIKSTFARKSSFLDALESVGLNFAKAKDANGDGILTVEEDIGYLRKNRPDMTEAELDNIRQLYAANGGQIAVTDYLKVATKFGDKDGTLAEHDRKVDEAAAKLADSPYGPTILKLFGKGNDASGASPEEKGIDSLKALMDLLSDFVSKIGTGDAKKAAEPSNISPLAPVMHQI